MVTTPGSIYFLRERDYQTGQISPYVKIGLVRNDKLTSTRISEHQTGNPREIIDFHTIQVPFVEDLETRLHYLYGHRWISGEWFILNDTEIKEVIKVAKDYAKRQTKIIRNHDLVSDLSNCSSNGLVLPTSKKAQQIFQSYIHLKSEQIIHEGHVDLIDTLLKQAMGKHLGIEGIISLQEKKSSTTFDKAAFIAANQTHAQLLETYLEVKPGDGIKSTWSVLHGLKLANINPELYTQLKQIEKVKIDVNVLKKKPKLRNAEIEKWHLDLILNKALLSRLDWELFELELELKVLTGVYDGIEDICNWKRNPKPDKTELNITAFKADHPALYEEFLKPPKLSVAFIVLPYRSYPIQF